MSLCIFLVCVVFVAETFSQDPTIVAKPVCHCSSMARDAASCIRPSIRPRGRMKGQRENIAVCAGDLVMKLTEGLRSTATTIIGIQRHSTSGRRHRYKKRHQAMKTDAAVTTARKAVKTSARKVVCVAR